MYSFLTSHSRRLSHIILVVAPIAIGVALTCLLVSQFVIDRLRETELRQNIEELPLALQEWQAAGITSYEIQVEFFSLWGLGEFGGHVDSIYLCGLMSDTLRIRDGHVIAAKHLAQCGDIFDLLTLDGAFTLAESHIGATNPALEELRFDPNFGYISWMSFRFPNSGHFVSLSYSNMVVLQD